MMMMMIYIHLINLYLAIDKFACTLVVRDRGWRGWGWGVEIVFGVDLNVGRKRLNYGSALTARPLV